MTGTVLITGGQRGIGFGIARALVETGQQVALAAHLPPEATEVVEALTALGPQAAYFRHDVRDIAAVPTLLDAVEGRFGPVTALVSNAGIGAPVRGDMLELRPENFDLVMEVNLRGGFFLAQEVARRMLDRPTPGMYRALIFVTSVSAEMVSIERAEYCLSKAGAAMMAKLFSVRLAPAGIGVFELRPGIIATEMTAGVRDTYTARIEGGLVPAGRWGEPRDIARIPRAILAGELDFATGATIPVDGGLSVARL